MTFQRSPLAPIRSLVLSASAAALMLALAGCTAPAAPDPTGTASDAPAPAAPGTACDGVAVFVDATGIDAPDVEQGCVATVTPIVAAEAFADLSFALEGTAQFGDAVVCRVNGEPAADRPLVGDDGAEYFETCETMAPMSAYWSLWMKPAGGEWEYAMEGASTQEVAPGDSIALVFTVDGQPETPGF